MIYVIIGAAAIAAFELPGLIKNRNAKEIAAVAVIAAAAVYYSVCYAVSVKAWSPFEKLMLWLDTGLGLSYDKLFGKL